MVESSLNADTFLANWWFFIDLYNAYLAPGSPCELNIDHTLRNALVSRMTKFELPEDQLLSTVKEVVDLYDQAMDSVYKLMAAVSVS